MNALINARGEVSPFRILLLIVVCAAIVGALEMPL